MFVKGHKPTEDMKAKQREGQQRRWAKFYADPESPEAREYRAKASRTGILKWARFRTLSELLNG